MKRFATCMTCVALAAPIPAQADLFAASKKKGVFSTQTKVLDNRASMNVRSTVNMDKPAFVTPTKWGIPATTLPYAGQYKGEYLEIAKSAAQRNGVPQDLFLKLVQQESGWNPNALSHKGAIGLAQLMPETARTLGVNPHDPKQNLEGGARYLAEQYRQFKSWRLALAAYNAGPGAVQKYGGVPPYKETKNYVKIIWGS